MLITHKWTLLIVIFSVGFLAGNFLPFKIWDKAVLPSPTVRPFGDNRNWIVIEDLAYRLGDTADFIVVPKGFVTDFASIPETLWSLGLSPHGQYSRAAIVHDYLYWTQGCTKEQADRLMVIAMKESDVGKFDEVVIYQGINLGGRRSWKRNADERESGLPRVLPAKFMKPDDPNIHWPEYRNNVFLEGVRDPAFEKEPAYCKYGDTMDIP